MHINLSIFDRNISENKYGKNEGSYLSCVTNSEFYFSVTKLCNHIYSPKSLDHLFGHRNKLRASIRKLPMAIKKNVFNKHHLKIK